MTNKNYIRPVINLKKCAIDGKCNNSCNNSSSSGNNNLYDYVVGNNVTYNNSNYCIIQNAKVSDDYITLIKQEPLTYDELVTYNNGYEIGRNNIDNNIGTISYYKSDTCYYNDENDKNITGCSNDYNDSFIKNVVNNWSNSIRNDLKEVNGYKARLITKDELNKMGHIYHSRTSSPVITQSEYSCLYIDTDYWTMGSSEDSAIKDILSKIDGNNGPEYVDKQYAVRPVINLKKCAITNTCE